MTKEDLKIKEELFDKAEFGYFDDTYFSDNWVTFRKGDIEFVVYTDGYILCNQTGLANLLSKEQFDEIIRVRKLLIEETIK